MTAEERARNLLETRGFSMRECVKSDPTVWVAVVAEAIRAAEDDALERARKAILAISATGLEGLINDSYQMASLIRDRAAETVQSLKSSGGTR